MKNTILVEVTPIWTNFNPNDDITFPPEGVDVLISDGVHYDVVYYIRSGEYKWLKINLQEDDVYEFVDFVPTKWKLIE